MTQQNLLRQLPAVNKLMQLPSAHVLIDSYGREAVLARLREVLDATRSQLLAGDTRDIEAAALIAQAAQQLERAFRPTLRPVINATGVIIHTNLGRALLSQAAQQAMLDVAAHYNNLEFSLETGNRGSRYVHAEALLQELTGAEAALVVNNNAAALVLLLSALAKGRGVIISRGQLVEIGGGFRIPAIMAQSGATLVEVGTTNRTRIADYAHAIDEETALLMRVHSSNFQQIGFVQAAALEEMAHLAHQHELLLVDDLGSGTLLDTSEFGLQHEPTIAESLQAGADLVTFSGDKLLGGPQAGILIGRRDIIDTLKRHPLARAIRADKLCYAALSATLDHYRRHKAAEAIPVWRMIAASVDTLRARASNWSTKLGGEVIAGESTVGGGSLPGTTLPTALLAVVTPSPDSLMLQLREAHIPVIARIADGRVLFDPRTILPEQDAIFLDAVASILQAKP